MRTLLVKTFLRFWLMLVLVAASFLVFNLLISRSIPEAGRVAVPFRKALFLFEVITFLTGTVFCYLITRHITRPVSRLRAAAASVADGHLETRIGAPLERRRDELGDLARDFNRMTDRIERLVTGQQRLLGDVSHELRSPLSRLIVALGLVRQRPLDASVHLDRIGLEAHRLDALIGQLLMLSRIDSGAQGTTRTTVDLANLLQEITGDADFEARAHGRTVTVSRADACTVDGFEELLRSALENVVRNAVRHTREGTSVDVSLRETRRSGRSIALVTVRDRGDGVPESMLMEMFLPFRRVSSEAPPDAEGSGLGLAITERAVTLHGGRVHAANAPDGGLVVEIELPV